MHQLTQLLRAEPRVSLCSVSRRIRSNRLYSAVRRPRCRHRMRGVGCGRPRAATLPVVPVVRRPRRQRLPVPDGVHAFPKEGASTTSTSARRLASGLGVPVFPKIHRRRLPEEDAGNEMGKLSFRALLRLEVRA